MIRTARPDDTDAIVSIWNPIIRETDLTFTNREKTAEDVAQMISERACFLVAEEDHHVLGFASFDQFRGGPGYTRTQEHTVILARAAQGKGLGRRIMTALETKAQLLGVRSLIAGISGSNVAGLRFHAAIGFEPVGVVREAGFKFGKPLDLHLMQKLL